MLNLIVVQLLLVFCVICLVWNKQKCIDPFIDFLSRIHLKIIPYTLKSGFVDYIFKKNKKKTLPTIKCGGYK